MSSGPSRGSVNGVPTSASETVYRGVRWRRTSAGRISWFNDGLGRWVTWSPGADAPPLPAGWGDGSDGAAAGPSGGANRAQGGPGPPSPAPVQPAPAQQAPAQPALAKQAPAQRTPAKQAPAKQAPARQAPAQPAPVNPAGARSAPVLPTGPPADAMSRRPSMRSPYRLAPLLIVVFIVGLALWQATRPASRATKADVSSAEALKGDCLARAGGTTKSPSYSPVAVSCSANDASVRVVAVLVPGSERAVSCPAGSLIVQVLEPNVVGEPSECVLALRK